MNQILLSICTVLSLVIIPQISVSAQILKPISLAGSWETWYDKIPVSGNLQVGLMKEFTSKKISSPTEFYCSIPKVHKKYLCAEISSQNGRYEAKLEYDVSALAEGEHQFSLPTSYTGKLRSFTTKEVAILLRGSDNCKSDGGEFYYGSWNPNVKSDSLFILLNTENPTFFVYEDATSKVTEVQCNPMQVQNAVSFNCLCRVALSALKKSKNFKILHRIRKGGVTKLIPYAFEIKI